MNDLIFRFYLKQSNETKKKRHNKVIPLKINECSNPSIGMLWLIIYNDEYRQLSFNTDETLILYEPT